MGSSIVIAWLGLYGQHYMAWLIWAALLFGLGCYIEWSVLLDLQFMDRYVMASNLDFLTVGPSCGWAALYVGYAWLVFLEELFIWVWYACRSIWHDLYGISTWAGILQAYQWLFSFGLAWTMSSQYALLLRDNYVLHERCQLNSGEHLLSKSFLWLQNERLVQSIGIVSNCR